jgi:hypothetical protein
MFRNTRLSEVFPCLIQKAEELSSNDPAAAWLIQSAKDLLFLNKRDTLAFIKGITDDNLMWYAISSYCWTRFPQKSFVAELKKEIDRFKDTKGYDYLFEKYQEAEKHLVDLAESKINDRAYRESLKKG